MSDNVITFPPPANDEPGARSDEPTQVEIDGEYLGSLAIDEAEGDYAAALSRLDAAKSFVAQRELVAKANRILGRSNPEPPEAA